MAALADFHFLRPTWLWALLPLAAMALLLLRQRLNGSAWRKAVDPKLMPWLLESSWRRTGRTLLATVFAAWALAVVALAGPTWQQQPQPVTRSGDALVIVLDLTLSMYAEDLAPARFVRARLKIEDILADRGDGQTALVVYAADSHVVVPLTDDVRTITNLLGPLEPRIMPLFGNRPDRAIRQANQLFLDSGIDRGRILLMTAGVHRPTELLTAVDERFPLSVLGVGTESGAPIPLERLNRDGQLRAGGEVVITRLDESVLSNIARSGGGRYARFAADGSDLQRLFTAFDAAQIQASDRQREHELWIDAGPWLILLLLPVALFAFRRGILAAPLLALILLPPDAAAWEWRNLLQRADQQAHRALQSGRPEAAAERFEDPDWRATALYRSQQYDQAARAFPGDDARSHYNRGTALARSEQFEAALAQFDAALDLDPDFDDARHNKELIERILEQDPPPAANDESSQRDNPSWDDDDEGSAVSRQGDGDPETSDRDPDTGEDEQQREGDQTEDPQSQSGEPEQPQQAEQTQAERDASTAEDREREQALEQWLRRINDDPSALLQRKFRYEAERRRREGHEVSESGPPW